ncbi:MAG TPA: pyridoxamine 5'-phosphate oxidase family protein [Chitinispirillaceae bacterium]|nr:pyridoxamine 5'-phosphate oxidase family protein [Chitinispirillaceae bacterium]
MKKFLFFFALITLFASCNNTSESKKSPADELDTHTTDAITGATGDKAHVLEIPQNEAINKVYATLKEAGPYYIATVENDKPRVRPVGIVELFNGKIWFHVGKHKTSYNQIQTNPHIEVATVGKNGTFFRVSGIAVCEDNPVLDEKIFKNYPMLKNIYNEKTGNTLGHFYVSNGVAEFPSDSGSVIVRF